MTTVYIPCTRPRGDEEDASIVQITNPVKGFWPVRYPAVVTKVGDQWYIEATLKQTHASIGEDKDSVEVGFAGAAHPQELTIPRSLVYRLVPVPISECADPAARLAQIRKRFESGWYVDGFAVPIGGDISCLLDRITELEVRAKALQSFIVIRGHAAYCTSHKDTTECNCGVHDTLEDV